MGYETRAASLAERLRHALGASVSLEKGNKGDFEILRDGRLVYSKQQTRRMPRPDQILDLLLEPGPQG
jgi:selT/selW/selH-like putative selenoprotein